MTKLGLRLEVKVGDRWHLVNHRDTRDYGQFPQDLLELLKLRDQWRMNEFPNHSFRVVHKERGRPEKVIA